MFVVNLCLASCFLCGKVSLQSFFFSYFTGSPFHLKGVYLTLSSSPLISDQTGKICDYFSDQSRTKTIVFGVACGYFTL